MKRKSIWGKLFSLCVLAVFLALIFSGITIWNYAEIDGTRPADAAIILGAAVQDDAPTPVFRERINHGIALYQDGIVDYLIFTGGIGEGDTQSEAAIAKAYAIEKGVPAEAIFTEDKSHITEENLINAKIILDENDLHTVLLVSDPLHMKRAMTMAADFGLQAYSSPTPTTMYQSLQSQLPFLFREIIMYLGYCILRPFR